MIWVGPTTQRWVEGSLALGALLIPMLLLALTFRAYLRFLRNLDEMLRRVQLEGAALGFAIAIALCCGYALLQSVGAPPPGIDAGIVVLSAGWAFGIVLAGRRIE